MPAFHTRKADLGQTSKGPAGSFRQGGNDLDAKSETFFKKEHDFIIARGLAETIK